MDLITRLLLSLDLIEKDGSGVVPRCRETPGIQSEHTHARTHADIRTHTRMHEWVKTPTLGWILKTRSIGPAVHLRYQELATNNYYRYSIPGEQGIEKNGVDLIAILSSFTYLLRHPNPSAKICTTQGVHIRTVPIITWITWIACAIRKDATHNHRYFIPREREVERAKCQKGVCVRAFASTVYRHTNLVRPSDPGRFYEKDMRSTTWIGYLVSTFLLPHTFSQVWNYRCFQAVP